MDIMSNSFRASQTLLRLQPSSTALRLFIFICVLATADPLSLSPSTNYNSKVVWFNDHSLRIQDNEALHTAILDCHSDPSSTSANVLPLYLWRTKEESHSVVNKQTGGIASDVFIAHALNGLNQTLDGKLALGIVQQQQQQHLKDDDPHQSLATIMAKELISFCQKTHSKSVYYISSNDIPYEKKLRACLQESGITPRSFHSGRTLIDYSEEDVPWKDIIMKHPYHSPLIPFVDYVLDKLEQENQEGKVSSITPIHVSMDDLKGVITSFHRGNDNGSLSNPVDIDHILHRVGKSPGGTDWGSSIYEAFPPTQESALEKLHLFLQDDTTASSISNNNNDDSEGGIVPKKKNTHFVSYISPYLARGMISARQVYHAILTMQQQVEDSSGSGDDDHEEDERIKRRNRDLTSFVRRICWRDYTAAVVAMFPDVLHGRAIRDRYDDVDRADDEKIRLLELWKQGKTGFPLVDAGMRQLAKEGFMPQQVRLATSTFLVEGLGISWRDGMQHFEEYLVDFDVAINSNMWMNAGCVGLDPYYCGMRYKKRPYWDLDGSYVRHWCPELRHLPDFVDFEIGSPSYKKLDCLYEPWTAPSDILETAKVILGQTYPLCAHDDRRGRKDFFQKLRQQRADWPPGTIDERKRDIVRLGRGSDAEMIGIFTPRAIWLPSPSRYSAKVGENA